MVINKKHKHVRRDGLVEIDYLKNWEPEYRLIDMIVVLSSTFSEDSPVYANSKVSAKPLLSTSKFENKFNGMKAPLITNLSTLLYPILLTQIFYINKK